MNAAAHKGLEFVKVHMSVIDANLKAMELSVYLALLLFADPQTGEGKFRKKQIAQILGISEKSVDRKVKALKTAQLATVTTHRAAKSTFVLSAFTSSQKQHKKVDTRIIDAPFLDQYHKAIYVKVLRYENRQSGEAYPTIGRITDSLTIGNSKAIDKIKELQRIGLLSVTKRKSTDAPHHYPRSHYSFPSIDDSVFGHLYKRYEAGSIERSDIQDVLRGDVVLDSEGMVINLIWTQGELV